MGCFHNGLGITTSLLHPPSPPTSLCPALSGHQEHFLNRPNHALKEAGCALLSHSQQEAGVRLACWLS